MIHTLEILTAVVVARLCWAALLITVELTDRGQR